MIGIEQLQGILGGLEDRDRIAIGLAETVSAGEYAHTPAAPGVVRAGAAVTDREVAPGARVGRLRPIVVDVLGTDTPRAMSPTGAVDTASRSAAARLGARAKPSARVRNFIEVSRKNQKAGDQRPLSST
ncbi:MAG: hypothetical protein OSW71_08980 [Proteobacteria bacterium]|nr:hypothetical protein [Pseudomonadota bacterium]